MKVGEVGWRVEIDCGLKFILQNDIDLGRFCFFYGKIVASSRGNSRRYSSMSEWNTFSSCPMLNMEGK